MKTTTNTADHLQALEEIIEYVTGSHAYLSQSSDYSRGYKNGVRAVKDNILDILAKHNVIETVEPEEE